MSKIFILLFMVFMHIVDDYYLQGVLAKMKQKSWWEENAPNKLYKKDYLMALFMHAFSWAFCIMLPLAIYFKFQIGIPFLILFISNVILHMWTDNLKANKKTINLIEDQIMHLLQILTTYALLLHTIPAIIAN